MISTSSRFSPKSFANLVHRLTANDKDYIGENALLAFAGKHWKAIAIAGGVALASYVLTKSGLAASLLNKMKWRRCEDDEIDPPPPGTPLLEDLGPGGLVEHSGIFLGHNTAAELHGNGIFQKVTLSRFLNGDETDTDNPRCGNRIFAACDLASHHPLVMKSAVEFANAHIDQRTEYNLLTNNCHRFTASCLLGEMQKPLGLKELLTKGVYSIACLEDVIVDRLNGGNPICWLSVRRCIPDFDFLVSCEKRDSLLKTNHQ